MGVSNALRIAEQRDPTQTQSRPNVGPKSEPKERTRRANPSENPKSGNPKSENPKSKNPRSESPKSESPKSESPKSEPKTLSLIHI